MGLQFWNKKAVFSKDHVTTSIASLNKKISPAYTIAEVILSRQLPSKQRLAGKNNYVSCCSGFTKPLTRGLAPHETFPLSTWCTTINFAHCVFRSNENVTNTVFHCSSFLLSDALSIIKKSGIFRQRNNQIFMCCYQVNKLPSGNDLRECQHEVQN